MKSVTESCLYEGKPHLLPIVSHLPDDPVFNHVELSVNRLVTVFTEQVGAVREHIEATPGALAVGHGYFFIHLEAIYSQVFA